MNAVGKIFAWVLLIVAIITAIAALSLGHRTILVASSEIDVDSYPVPDRSNSSPIGKIKAGHEVKVLSCDDLKSYRAVHVLLDDGKEGYVIGGKYLLKQSSIWSGENGPISFSCPSEWP